MEKGPNTKINSSIHSPLTSKWLSEYEVLTHFHICKSTLHSWFKEAGLPKYQIKRVTFYKEKDLDKLLQRHRIVAAKIKPNKKEPIRGKK